VLERYDDRAGQVLAEEFPDLIRRGELGDELPLVAMLCGSIRGHWRPCTAGRPRGGRWESLRLDLLSWAVVDPQAEARAWGRLLELAAPLHVQPGTAVREDQPEEPTFRPAPVWRRRAILREAA
jgi:hypothetical protein